MPSLTEESYFAAFSGRAFRNAMSLSLLKTTRTPFQPLLTRIFPPFRALWSASQSMNSGLGRSLVAMSRRIPIQR
jgi:hypothetical protein